MIGSSEINKQIRKIISPLLRENGFSKIRTRNNWGYHGECIWVFNLRAVGNYFSLVTEFPPMSLTAGLGVYFEFIPGFEKHVKKDKDGKLLPKEYMCHMRHILRTNNIEAQKRGKLSTPLEEVRDDIWWIEPDGSNVDAMLWDIQEILVSDGLPWLQEMTNLEIVMEELRKERDCINKYRRAMHVARKLGLTDESLEYHERLKEKQTKLDGVRSQQSDKKSKDTDI
ncbi:MAG: hypothetical protein JXA82_02465 [Sedimentisphaerales bacterium]|nr:hypothetical protein [Sedimentisphaerales bacterium]